MFNIGEYLRIVKPDGEPFAGDFQRYEIIGAGGSGGYGAIYRIIDHKAAPSLTDQRPQRAIKVLKPEHAQNKKASHDFLEEIDLISRIQNPYIIKILDWGYAGLPGGDKGSSIPFYVMEWIEGTDLQKVLDSKTKLPLAFFVQMARQILSALKACHLQKEPIIHLDIKPDNILLSRVSPPAENAEQTLALPPASELHFMLTDFGKAKLLASPEPDKDQTYDTAGGGIYRYVHPRLRQYLRKNKVPREILMTYGCQCDIYSLGVVFSDVFSQVTGISDKEDRERSSWEHLIYDMQWHDELKKDPLKGLPTASEALDLIDKLSTASGAEFQLDEKSREEGLIRLQEQVSIPFSFPVRQLVDSPEFQRLRGISQLGLSSLVYPSATHTRFSHAIGSYHYACQYLASLQRHPVFQYLFDERDVFATQLAALLHDVGHYPYAHYFEEMSGLKVAIDHVRLTKKLISGDLTFRNYLSSPLAQQFLPGLGIDDISEIKECFQCEPLGQRLRDVMDHHGISSNRIADIFEGEGQDKILKCIIDGPLDCDKLDYLRRDGAATGVPYANAVDISRFFSTLTIDTRELHNLELAVTAKGKSAVESIVAARYNLFSEVYWHKTARAAAAMIKDAFWDAQNQIDQAEFDLAAIGLDDKHFLLWIASNISDRKKARDLLVKPLCIANIRMIYKRVKTYASVWEEPEKKTLHQRFTEELGKHYAEVAKYRDKLVKRLNKSGKERASWRTLLKHHVLVDVPYSKQDQYGSVAIKYPDAIEGRVFYSLNAVSQLSKAIYESFAEHTKKVRIFCHPDVADQVRSLGKGLDKAIKEAWQDDDQAE